MPTKYAALYTLFLLTASLAIHGASARAQFFVKNDGKAVPLVEGSPEWSGVTSEPVPPSYDSEPVPPSYDSEPVPPSHDSEPVPPSHDSEPVPPSYDSESVAPNYDPDYADVRAHPPQHHI